MGSAEDAHLMEWALTDVGWLAPKLWATTALAPLEGKLPLFVKGWLVYLCPLEACGGPPCPRILASRVSTPGSLQPESCVGVGFSSKASPLASGEQQRALVAA